MIREEAIKLMQGAACSKTLASSLALYITQAAALKLIRHYVKCLPKGAEIGNTVTQRVLAVTESKRSH